MGMFDDVESAFQGLKRNPRNAKGVDALSDALTTGFKKTIVCSIVTADFPVGRFVMSITPLDSTIDKIMAYAADGMNKVDTIVSIWKGCNHWKIEINKAVIKLLNPDELTALTCHEVFHMLYSDRYIKRLQDALSFAINTCGVTSRAMLTARKFQNLVRIPGIISCQMIFQKGNIIMEARQHKEFLKNEMMADGFSAKQGYRIALINAIEKLERAIAKEKPSTKNPAEVGVDYTMSILNDLGARKNNLAKQKLVSLKKVVPGSLLTEAVNEAVFDLFERDPIILEHAQEDIRDQVFEELGFFTKRLAPITMNQVDYAYVKCENIRTESDKMMVLSYVNSKIELCDYYIAILNDPKMAKKYIVPHSRNELDQIRKKLMSIREAALAVKIRTEDKDIIVYYPSGYEG